MSKANTTEVDILAKVFKATALPWDAATDLDLHLHVADPGEGGTSATSPATYTGYVPITVARSGAAWSGTNPVTNAALLQFPVSGSAQTLTHLSITPSGSTQILYSGALTSPLNVDNLIQPQFSIGALAIAED